MLWRDIYTAVIFFLGFSFYWYTDEPTGCRNLHFKLKEVGLTERGVCKAWCHKGGGVGDVILVYPEREGKEGEREKGSSPIRFFVYISPKLNKLSLPLTGGL